MTTAPIASGRDRFGLDWLSFFVSNVQTGFGPFIAVYLTSEAWTLREIGEMLTVGTVTAMLCQLPGGALVDALRDKGRAAFAAAVAVAASAMLFAIWPDPLPVALAEVLHGAASCILGPAIAAISLQLVGRAGFGERLGRNARFAALGSGSAAAIFGVCGTYVSEQSVFVLTALLMVPGLVALRMIQVPPDAAVVPAVTGQAVRLAWQEIRARLLGRDLLVFAGCVVLFHVSNAAMLPLAASAVTSRVGDWASMVVAGFIILPQFVVAGLSPAVGRLADRRGRRIVLLVGFAALPLRGVLMAVFVDPVPLMIIQMLDGVSGAAFGVLLPLVAADLTRGTNRFNLCLAGLGLASGAGASISTLAAGAIADAHGETSAFLTLALFGLLATALVAWAMPETGPSAPGAAHA